MLPVGGGGGGGQESERGRRGRRWEKSKSEHERKERDRVTNLSSHVHEESGSNWSHCLTVPSLWVMNGISLQH